LSASRWRFNVWDSGLQEIGGRLFARLLINPLTAVSDYNGGDPTRYSLFQSVSGSGVWIPVNHSYYPRPIGSNFPYGREVESDRM